MIVLVAYFMPLGTVASVTLRYVSLSGRDCSWCKPTAWPSSWMMVSCDQQFSATSRLSAVTLVNFVDARATCGLCLTLPT